VEQAQPEISNEESSDYQNGEEWGGFFRILNTPVFTEFIHRPEKTIAFFTGNQFGKNVTIMKHYILRWMGEHPIESKNLRPHTKIRTYRFCTETLPNDPDASQANRNTVYPVLKAMIPHRLIKKDITTRSPIMTIADPIQGGPDFYVEFVSYGQELQSQAGVQRCSVYIDENCPYSFFEEQQPRLLASDGDIVIGMTPALGQVTWQYEHLYENARTIYRTPLVRARYKKRFDEDLPEIQHKSLDSDICVLMAATDDNPFYDFLVYEKNKEEENLILSGKHPLYKSLDEFKVITKDEYITSKLKILDDESEDVRRYGIFRQVSGRIFKDFDQNIHASLQIGKLFEDKGIPHIWVHARGIDYHEHVDWHVGFMALSPQDEAFIYDEVVMSPERNVTSQIAQVIASKSKDYKYLLSKIDPLAMKTQSNTGLSTVDDLNRMFAEFKKDGIGTGGWWTSWDTKSTRGREEIRKRLKNSRLCGVPFNNRQVVMGREIHLPTLWILPNCRIAIEYFKNWRLEEWTDRTKLETKEMKETPMQRYSHLPMVIEALMKEDSFRPKRGEHLIQPRHTALQYGRT
jgi:hypothetical protein